MAIQIINRHFNISGYIKMDKKMSKLDYLVFKIERIEKLLFKLHEHHGIVKSKALPRSKIMFVGESDNED